MKRHSGELCRGDASFFVSSTTTEPRAPHPLLPTPRKVDVGVLISSVDRVDGEETASRRVVEANTHESNATGRFAGALLSAEPAVAGGVGAGKQVSVFVVDVVWAPMSPWMLASWRTVPVVAIRLPARSLSIRLIWLPPWPVQSGLSLKGRE